ncbi:M14 metallopeptidase family protein [Sungkyunkwania multivorans]|uniref:M14 metallopeptidase family protein n=1 Tax=Sungkyunkwania multivorans TaxID=1173618 RepID=A0ABW3CXC8_9FLAO
MEAFPYYKETSVTHRYVTHKMVEPILEKLPPVFKVERVGSSVRKNPIHMVTIGTGSKSILMWSQMHGNESTTTKALLDMFKYLQRDDDSIRELLSNCTLYVIPILNPDGATDYTRVNANEVDLNRDASMLSQPESKVLRSVFEQVHPEFCFNLHDQRTIFGVGDSDLPATVSFLAPAMDAKRTVDDERKRSMEVVAHMNSLLQGLIPGQIGRYDDTFNINCVGDKFQSRGVPTILFESGHFPEDYSREETRKYIFQSLVSAVTYIAFNDVDGKHYRSYFDIPENQKTFNDLLIKGYPIKKKRLDVIFQFKEVLDNNKITFDPICLKIGNLKNLKAHKTFNYSELSYKKELSQTFSVNKSALNLLKNFNEVNDWLIKISQ